MLKSLIAGLFCHHQLQALKRQLFAVHDMTTSLEIFKLAGFVATGAIDGGVHDRDWAPEFWSVMPGVPMGMNA